MEPETGELYRRFATREARGNSASYQELSERCAEDVELMGLVSALPAPKRQPNLLFGAVRFLGGPVGDGYPAFRAWVLARWEDVRAAMLRRRTQTNEPGRCASLLPLLAALPQPLALIEVGASAGLCLYPDRYRYRYDGRPEFGPGDGPATLECATSGPVPFPARLPEVVWRAGVDLNPLDVRDEEDVRWLEALVWPEQTARLERLRGAVRIARADPPELVRGDLNETVRELVARAPEGATPVVFHSAVLSYLPPEAREEFAATMRTLPGHWISNESPVILPEVLRRLPRPAPADLAVFALALDEQPVAIAAPHGQWLDWFGA
ncbi:DUF2332 domain-containing protein [Kitasatospora sp. NPDC092286]|uniref:DUF2332 domain-containing protein n=1 Tax=Kitasatospora sp. NPDC092286 TaxID=3364087 RepID=UPI00382E25A3